MTPISISIITPVYNGERYIRETIESVLHQTYNNIEYIIVDGGSTDGTMDIVSEYETKIAHIISEPDKGMYDAINKGISRSSGDVVCYINSDDLYYPDTICKVVSHFNSADIELCFGDFQYIDETGKELSRFFGVDLSYANALKLYRIPFAQQTAFWRRSVYDKIGGFDLKYKYVSDTKFFYEALKIVGERKRYIHDFLAKFRTHKDAFSIKVHKEMEIEHHEILKGLGGKKSFISFALDMYVKWKNRSNILRKII